MDHLWGAMAAEQQLTEIIAVLLGLAGGGGAALGAQRYRQRGSADGATRADLDRIDRRLDKIVEMLRKEADDAAREHAEIHKRISEVAIDVAHLKGTLNHKP